MQPLVSVILPVRNCGHYLLPAVNSIINQTLSDLELIIVDDGSSDGALQSLPTDTDRRIKILKNPGRGVVSATNYGARHARAPYLARMDGDDIALPQRLQRQFDFLEYNPDIGISGTQVEIFNEESLLGEGYQHYQTWINNLTESAAIRREIFVESPLPNPSIMMRTKTYQQLGGYHESRWAEDYDFWLRAFECDIKMAKPEGILLRWRDHPQRTSRCDKRYSLQHFTQAKAHYLARTVLKDTPAVIWGAAPTGAQLFDALAAEGAEISAFIDIDPKKIGGRKRGKPVLPWQAAAEINDAVILGAVGSRGARQEIRTHLLAMGKQEGADFWFAA